MKHLHMRTEQKKSGDLTDTGVQKMATFGHRAKDCCAIMIQLLARKMAASPFGHIQPKTHEHCDITDQNIDIEHLVLDTLKNPKYFLLYNNIMYSNVVQ